MFVVIATRNTWNLRGNGYYGCWWGEVIVAT